MNILMEFSKKGYNIHNKRVLGNPLYTSKETRYKDLIQEYALLTEWLRIEYNIWISIQIAHNENNRWYIACIEKDELGYYYKPLDKSLNIGGTTPQEVYSEILLYIIKNLIN